MACLRLYGGSIKDCECRLPGGGWGECPPEARRVIPKTARQPSLSGEFCDDCGVCLLCLDCGGSSGGCS